jgi:hypothetical protein
MIDPEHDLPIQKQAEVLEIIAKPEWVYPETMRSSRCEPQRAATCHEVH